MGADYDKLSDRRGYKLRSETRLAEELEGRKDASPPFHTTDSQNGQKSDQANLPGRIETSLATEGGEQTT